MSTANYSTIDDAIAAAGSRFLVTKKNPLGRPSKIPPPDGSKEWEAETFKQALDTGELPKAQYLLAPVGNVKGSQRKVSLDLSFSENSFTVGPEPQGEDAALSPALLPASVSLQESVVSLIAARARDDQTRIIELEQRNEQLLTEITDLKVKLAVIETQQQSAAESGRGTMESLLVNFLNGPAGPIIAGKLLGSTPSAST